MANKDIREINKGRRDFIKTSAVAAMGSKLAVTSVYAKETGISPKPETGVRYWKKNKNLLCLSESRQMDQGLIESIKSNPEIDFDVSMIQVNYDDPQKLMESIQGKDPGILLVYLPFMTFSFGRLSQYMGNLEIPILLFSPNKDVIMVNANFAAQLRAKGINVKYATSEAELIDMLKTAASPGILEGKKALVFGRPFDSTSQPALNLTKDYVYKHTGLDIEHRPLEELATGLKKISKADAVEEMERWKKEAKKVDKIPDDVLLDECKMYILLRSIIEEEGLSAISIDCLRFTLLGLDPILPLPCLAFARLRDEGITASCEADICGLLTSMVLEKISGKSSYFANVSSVDKQKSSTVLRHCTAPLKLMGPDNPQLPYELHDYHRLGKGLVPKVEFPVDIEVTMGSYTKDLKDFVLWPGKTSKGIDDIGQPFFPNNVNSDGAGATFRDGNPPPSPMSRMEGHCANRAEIEIKDVNRFFENIAGTHHIMVAGNYTKEVSDVMSAENVNIIGPIDSNTS